MVDARSVREALVSRSVERVAALFKEYDVVIVIPPSPLLSDIASRTGEVAPKASILDLRKRGDPVGSVVDRVKSRSKGEKVLMLPKDTFTASEIAESLKREDRSAKVCLLNIAGIAEDSALAKNLSLEVRRLRVDYGPVRKKLDKIKVRIDSDHRGVQLAPLIGGEPGTVEEIRGLAPDNFDFFREIKETIGRLFPEVSLASVIDRLLVQIGLPPAIQADKIPVDVMLSLRKKMMARKELCKRSIMEFFTKSSRVVGYVDEETYRDVFDYVAIQWNLRLEELSNLVRNAGGMLASRGPGEVEKLVEEGLRKIEEKIREHERRLSELENKAKTTHAILGIYRDVEEFPYIRLENNRFYIRVGEGKQELAITRDYEKLADELLAGLVENKFVVLKGSSGSGKSTLIYYTIAKMFLENREKALRVYIVNKLDDREKRLLVENLLEVAKESLLRVILVYDPVSPEVYTVRGHDNTIKEEYDRVSSSISHLLDISSSYHDTALVIIALPNNLYEHVKSYLAGIRQERLKLLEKRAIDLDEKIGDRRREFVEKILEVYSGCANLGEIAGKIAEFESSHALIAKYAGLMLKKYECRVSDLNELLSSAQSSSEKLLENIVRAHLGLLGQGSAVIEYLKKYGMILALRRPFTDIPFGEYIVTPTLMTYLMEYIGLEKEEVGRNHIWLSMKNEDLVERALNRIIEEARKRSPYIRDLKKIEVAEYILTKWGSKLESEISKSVGQDLDCWRKAIFIVGFAPFHSASLLRFKDAYNEFKESLIPGVDRECVAEGIFIVDDDIPVLVNHLILASAYSAYSARSIVKPAGICSLIHKTIEDVANLGEKPTGIYPYLLGLAVTSLENYECADEALRLLRWVFECGFGFLDYDMTKHISENVASRLNYTNRPALRVQVASLLAHYITKHDKACETALMAYRDVGKLKSWEKAILAEAFSDVAFWSLDAVEHYYELGLKIGDKIMKEDGQLGAVITSLINIEMAEKLATRGKHSETLSKLSNLPREINNIREAIKKSGVSDALKKYLKLRYLSGPEKVNDLLLDMEKQCLFLEAYTKSRQGVETGRRDLLIEASEKYDEVAERFKGTCRYFALRLASIASKIIAVERIDGEVLKELEELYTEVLETDCLLDRSMVVISRAVLKSVLNQLTENDVETVRRALLYYKYIDPHRWAALSLLLNILTNGSLDLGEIPSLGEIREIYHVHSMEDILALGGDYLIDKLLGGKLPEIARLLESYGFPKELARYYARDLAEIPPYALAFLFYALLSRDFLKAAVYASSFAVDHILFKELVGSIKRAVETNSIDEKTKLLLAEIHLYYTVLILLTHFSDMIKSTWCSKKSNLT